MVWTIALGVALGIVLGVLLLRFLPAILRFARWLWIVFCALVLIAVALALVIWLALGTYHEVIYQAGTGARSRPSNWDAIASLVVFFVALSGVGFWQQWLRAKAQGLQRRLEEASRKRDAEAWNRLMAEYHKRRGDGLGEAELALFYDRETQALRQGQALWERNEELARKQAERAVAKLARKTLQ